MPTALLFSLPILGVLFWLIERPYRTPDRPRRTRSAWRVDLAYWFFTPLITRPFSRAIIGVVVFLGAASMGIHVDRETGIAPLVANSPVSTLPPLIQAMLILVLGDFLAYWMHRATHQGWLWRLHAIHHSPRRLDWLSAARVHPLNTVLLRSAQVVPLLLLGFDPIVLAGVSPFFGLYALLLHARVPWTYGPLGYLIASPAFHRWHHSQDVVGKNFAGLFSAWDLLFGTFYLPRKIRPGPVGVANFSLPERLWAQLWSPWNAKLWADRS